MISYIVLEVMQMAGFGFSPGRANNSWGVFMFDIGFLFGQKNPPLFGLDISTSGIRLVELSEVCKNGLRLERYAFEPLPPGAIVGGNIENIEQVSEAVRRIWKKSGSHLKGVALGMPPASVITKKIILSAELQGDELEMQVESEASQYIPFALDDVSLDFDKIGPVPNSPEDIEVMLAAARKEKVEDRAAVAEAAGLKPLVVDIESYAARAAIDRIIAQLPQAGQDKIVALFQIGAQAMHVSVLLNRTVIYEREQPFGGDQLTQDIVRAYGLSFEEANAKKKSGGLPHAYENDLLKPFLESAAMEVMRSIQFFFTSTPHARVDQLFLAGGCANIPGLLRCVLNRTNIPSFVVNPFMGMQLAGNLREAQLCIDAPAYLVACGLAMRRFG